MEIVKCVKCRCPGNQECVYPPEGTESEFQDCAIDAHTLMCPCCLVGIDRMSYRPNEDGQEGFEFESSDESIPKG